MARMTMNISAPATAPLADAGTSAQQNAGAGAVADRFEDRDMIRTAALSTRDLVTPKPAIYWADMLASAIIGYGGAAAAIAAPNVPLMLLAAVVAILGLYRAGSFIHEITHIKDGSVPFFRLGWNLLVGIPLMVPSFMYEGIHSLHHARTRYGTIEDPEYLPLALMKPWTVPLFVAVAALAPLALIIRYGVLTPLSLLIPPLRKVVVERYSGLMINPSFRRQMPTGTEGRNWMLQEAGASLWALFLMVGAWTGVLPLRGVLIFLGIAGGAVVLNQIRTLVAHLWANDGEVLTVTEQYLDSVNVPPPGLLPALWAPVGLRYHALHHLLPGLPYHALGEAHRRLSAALPAGSTYFTASYPGLPGLVVKLVRGTMHQHP